MKKEDVGKKILQLRKKYGLTQADMAKRLGVTGRTVSAWESGVSAPAMDTLYKICNSFRISTDYFIGEESVVEVKNSGMQSVRELYRIGFGPSSSHTMGPEKICRIFKKANPDAERFEVTLFGSLAQTGVGHGTDNIVRKVLEADKTEVIFDETKTDLPHPNTMELKAFKNGKIIDKRLASSIGGAEIKMDGVSLEETREVYVHRSFDEIKAYCKENGIRLWQYVESVEGEGVWDFLSEVWEKMKECINHGLSADGILPGGLGVSRKAKQLYEKAHDESPEIRENRLVCAYAYAVGEENAAGETIVTAPTCGASGVLPAVLYYYQNKKNYDDRHIMKALATASVVGNLIKTNASISGAECGCQAEIGSACSMAAAALCELYELNIDQIEYAAEIAMEHHLGLTCDPVRGLVQIPCIERNAVAAMRAINAVNLSNILADTRKISLDLVIKTMYETGRDMSRKYRETSAGGLAKLYEEIN